MFDLSQYTLNKILLAVGSFAGVSIVNVLWQPAYLKHKGVLAAAVTTTAMAITVGTTLGGAAMIWLGVDPKMADMVLAVGLTLGAVSPFVLNAIRNFFIKYEDKDVITLVKDVKEDIK